MEQIKISAKQFRAEGIKLKEVPVPKKFFSCLDARGKSMIATCTYPIMKRKIILYWCFFLTLVTGILLSTLTSMTEIGGFLLLIGGCFVLLTTIKYSNLLDGYMQLSGDGLFILGLPIFLIGMVFKLLLTIIFAIFPAKNSERRLDLPRIVLPAGMGLDDIIYAAEEEDKLGGLFNTIMEMSNSAGKEYYGKELKAYDEKLKKIDNSYNTATADEQKAYDVAKKHLEEERRIVQEKYDESVD
ncbi:MAG: hypothetical protein EOM87_06460 [Clostridia bacterium]|nr:hypothetical protein [Clostridia bacterium]